MSDPGTNDAPGGMTGAPELPPQRSPGAQLAAFRKERGWAVEQVASQLNLAPRQVVAIESDDYASLPGMPIVRGFVRAYAKLLKVDAAPLLAMLGGETVLTQEPMVLRKTLSTPFSEARLPSMVDRPGLSSKWVVSTLVLVLLMVAIWAAQQSAEIVDLERSVTAQVRESLASLIGSEAKPQGGVPEKPRGESEVPPAPVQAEQPASAPLAESGAMASGVEQSAVQQSEAVTSEQTSQAAPVEKDALELKANEESWVEVRRLASNGSMLARLMKPSESETIEITEPVLLVIGNAGGVDVTLRGAPVDIKGGRGNVARLNLK